MISKVFKAYDVRALYPDPLGEDDAWKVGYATAELLKQENGGKPGKVVVSRDHRPAAPSMAGALISGIRAAGMDVIDVGKCDTSVQYFAIPHLGAVGGVQCTASHNPIEYIGFKISRAGAKPVGMGSGLEDIRDIAQKLEDDDKPCPEPVGGLDSHDIWDDYAKHIRSFLKPALAKPVKLFVDCSNGMGTTLLDKVFNGIDNLEVIAVNDTYTDNWAHEPNPLVEENMVPTQQGVREHGCDLGACFDGDADRCMLVDDKGELCGCDHLTAMLAETFVKMHPGGPIVYDLRSSKVVEETIDALGVKPVRSKVGHVNIKQALRESDGSFGGELSGHFYFKDNSFADSGAILLAVALGLIGGTDAKLSDLIAPFRKYPQSGERNYTCDDKDAVLTSLKTDFGQGADLVDDLDGVTVDCWSKGNDAVEGGGYWFNVRASNTEPLLRLNAEAKDEATLAALLAKLTPRLGTPAVGH
ncbi:MAG: phosphomannomutase/phosphoglucomutase [Planctomycetota bacterium]